jgi:hypothetical protein
MSNEYLIHRYLSGELSPEDERQLFDALAESEELRSELSLQLSLQHETQKDLHTVTVPPATTKAIFSSLGFNAPLSRSNTLSFRAGRRMFTPRTSTIFSTLALIVALASFAYMVTEGSDEPDAFPRSVSVVSVDPGQSVSLSREELPLITEAPEQRSDVIHPELPLAKSDPTSEHTSPGIEHRPRVIPNEPIKAYFDIGKFSSVDYLTQKKIIGVADGGKIYCSEDGGKSWVMQDSKTSHDLFGVNFVDTAHGVIVGANGTILVTPNAGRTWEMIEARTKVNQITVRYATPDTVYACGSEGMILRSTTGGREWHLLESGITASLFKIRFSNGSNGTVSGERGITLQTHDAGLTWEIK